jgi:tRNA1Val (adenine37-N6)-methyltransferase
VQTTVDSLLNGDLLLEQPASGYRFNQDSVHLAHFASVKRCTVACDLGAGVGVIGLLLLRMSTVRHMTGVELNPALAELAASNAIRNNLHAQYSSVTADVSTLPDGDAALVVMNPPYFVGGTLPAGNARSVARHGELEPFVHAARRQLGRRGVLCFVYPADLLLHAFAVLAGAQLVPKRLQFVHGAAGRPARVALIQAQVARPGGLTVLPPLVE